MTNRKYSAMVLLLLSTHAFAQDEAKKTQGSDSASTSQVENVVNTAKDPVVPTAAPAATPTAPISSETPSSPPPVAPSAPNSKTTDKAASVPVEKSTSKSPENGVSESKSPAKPVTTENITSPAPVAGVAPDNSKTTSKESNTSQATAPEEVPAADGAITTPKVDMGVSIPKESLYDLTLPKEFEKDLETENAYIAELGPDAKDVDAKAYTRKAVDDSLLIVNIPVEKSSVGNTEYWSKIISAGQESAFSENGMIIKNKVISNGTTASALQYQRTTYLIDNKGHVLLNISYVMSQPGRVYLAQFTLPAPDEAASSEAVKFTDGIMSSFSFK